MSNKLIPDLIALLILAFGILLYLITGSVLASVLITLAILAVILIITAIVLNKQKKEDAHKQNEIKKIERAINSMEDDSVYKTTYLGYIQNNNSPIAKAIAEIEPTFDLNSFLLWAQKIFSLATDNVNDVQTFTTSEQFKRLTSGKAHILKSPNQTAKAAYLNHYKRDSYTENLYVCVITLDSDIKYILQFTRSLHCPHCSAKLPLTTLGKCTKCGFILDKTIDEWKLCDISLLTYNTVIDNRPFEITKDNQIYEK